MRLFSFFKKPTMPELVAEGRARMGRGDLGAAFEKAKAAAAADPSAAAPLGLMADILARQCMGATPGEEVTRLYRQAEGLARTALERDDEEDSALFVLGRLARLRQPPTHEPATEALKLAGVGHDLFQEGRFDEARRSYDAAAHADPAFAEAVKFAGNCHFAAQRFVEAEENFRRAVEIDPLDAQAHHFLADACLAQSKRLDALAAAMASIEANPAYYPAWQVIRSLREAQGRALKPFPFRPRAYVEQGEDGKPTIALAEEVGSSAHASMVWATYALFKHGLDALAPPDPSFTPPPPASTPFGMELRGLCAAFEVLDTRRRAKTDAAGLGLLHELRALAKDGELETAVLFLAYDEDYRDELESHKREHPGAFAHFMDRHGLRPY